VTGRVKPLPTTMDEGLVEFNGQGLEILLTERVVWCEALESATRLLTKLGAYVVPWC
jgi:hypothetical protein